MQQQGTVLTLLFLNIPGRSEGRGAWQGRTYLTQPGVGRPSVVTWCPQSETPVDGGMPQPGRPSTFPAARRQPKISRRRPGGPSVRPVCAVLPRTVGSRRRRGATSALPRSQFLGTWRVWEKNRRMKSTPTWKLGK